MRKIEIGTATEGMVLAKPLLNATGKTLLAQGCKLTERIIARLTEWECDVLFVEGDPQCDDEKGAVVGFDFVSRDIEDIFAEIEARFHRVNDDPIMAKIKTTLKEQIIKRYQGHESREERAQTPGQQD